MLPFDKIKRSCDVDVDAFSDCIKDLYDGKSLEAVIKAYPKAAKGHHQLLLYVLQRYGELNYDRGFLIGPEMKFRPFQHELMEYSYGPVDPTHIIWVHDIIGHAGKHFLAVQALYRRINTYFTRVDITLMELIHDFLHVKPTPDLVIIPDYMNYGFLSRTDFIKTKGFVQQFVDLEFMYFLKKVFKCHVIVLSNRSSGLPSHPIFKFDTFKIIEGFTFDRSLKLYVPLKISV